MDINVEKKEVNVLHMGIIEKYHNALLNRDQENQHPLKSITGIVLNGEGKKYLNDKGEYSEVQAGQIIVDNYDLLPTDVEIDTTARTINEFFKILKVPCTSLVLDENIVSLDFIDDMSLDLEEETEEGCSISLYRETENEDVCFYLEISDGNASHPYLYYAYSTEHYDEESQDDIYEHLDYIFAPCDLTIDAEEGQQFIVTKGWYQLEDESILVPIDFSEIPKIENCIVDELGPKAYLLYPFLLKTTYFTYKAGEYLYNGTEWVLQDYVYKIDLLDKVDKEAGKGLSTNDYSDVDKSLVSKIHVYGNPNNFLSEAGTYQQLFGQLIFDNYGVLPSSSDYPKGILVYCQNNFSDYFKAGYYFSDGYIWTYINLTLTESQICKASQWKTLDSTGWDINTKTQFIEYAHDVTKRFIQIEFFDVNHHIVKSCDVEMLKRDQTGIYFHCDTIPDQNILFKIIDQLCIY